MSGQNATDKAVSPSTANRPDDAAGQPASGFDGTDDAATLASRLSEPAIRAELLMARKRPRGLSPHVMVQCPVMCDLLGNGDPEVASVELGHKLLEIIRDNDDVMADVMVLEAACYS